MSLARAPIAPDTMSRSDRFEPALDHQHRALARQALSDLSPRLDLSALVQAHQLRRATAPQISSRPLAAPRA